VEAPSGEFLQGKGRCSVLCRLHCVIHAWALQSGLYTMQGAIQVLCFTFYLTCDKNRKLAQTRPIRQPPETETILVVHVVSADCATAAPVLRFVVHAIQNGSPMISVQKWLYNTVSYICFKIMHKIRKFCFLHDIWSFHSQTSHWLCCHQMPPAAHHPNWVPTPCIKIRWTTNIYTGLAPVHTTAGNRVP